MVKPRGAVSRPTIYLTKREHIGPGLRQIRTSQELTQLDVALAANMDPTHMGAYERNHTVPTTWKLIQILTAHRYGLVMVPLEECPEWVQ